MISPGLTYVPGTTPVHRCDARAKVVVLFAFSIAIFFATTWWAIALFALAALAAVLVARIPVERMLRPLAPVAVMAAFGCLFVVIGKPDAEGVISGLIVAVRMLALVAASLVVCYTSTSRELLRAFTFFVKPLAVLHVPVDDVAFTLALAIRFIPVIVEEFDEVRKAQRSRGADLAGRSFRRSLEIWGAAFSAVFVGLFRHADSLADAMDSRCYGSKR